MVSPESALISLRRMVRPAPVVGLYRSLSTCCWTDDEASMTVAAWPNASEAPNPLMVWKVCAPLIVAVSAAAAGPAVTASPHSINASAPTPATTRGA